MEQGLGHCVVFTRSCVQLREAGVVAKLRDLLGNGPRQRFHGARGLVYMGELDLAPSNVFTDGECCEVDSVVLSTDEDDGHSYARSPTQNCSGQTLIF